jgi:hypothetical protein
VLYQSRSELVTQEEARCDPSTGSMVSGHLPHPQFQNTPPLQQGTNLGFYRETLRNIMSKSSNNVSSSPQDDRVKQDLYRNFPGHRTAV